MARRCVFGVVVVALGVLGSFAACVVTAQELSGGAGHGSILLVETVNAQAGNYKGDVIDEITARWIAADKAISERNSSNILRLRRSHGQLTAQLNRQLEALSVKASSELAKRQKSEIIRAQLGQANREFIEGLSKEDPDFSKRITNFRRSLSGISNTPEGLEALALFAKGEEQKALSTLDEKWNKVAREIEHEKRVEIAAASRDIANLALDALRRSRTSLQEVIRRFESIVDLDPSFFPDHIQLSRLHERQGNFDKALSYAKSALNHSDEPRDIALVREQIGDLRLLNGEPQAALEHYKVAQKIIDKMVDELTGNDTTAIRNLSIVYAKMGDVYFSLKQWQQALKFYQQDVALLNSLGDQLESNVDLQRDAAIAQTNEGRVFIKLNQEGLASEHLASARKHLEALVTKDPNITLWHSDLVFLSEQEAELSLLQGDIAKARSILELALASWVSLIKDDAGQSKWVTRASRVSFRLGGILYKQGDMKKAIERYENGLQLLQESPLTARDSVLINREVAIAHGSLAEVTASLGDRGKSLQHYRTAIELLQGVSVQTDYDREALLQYYLRMGNHYFSSNAYSEALTHYTKSRQLYDDIDYSKIDSEVASQDLRFILMKLGDTHFALNDVEKSLDAYKQALGLSIELADDDRENHQYVAEASLKLGRLFSQDFQYELAEKYFDTCVNEVDELLSHKDVTGLVRLQSNCLYFLAYSRQKQGLFEQSKQTLKDAVAVVLQGLASVPEDGILLGRLALTYDLLGDAFLVSEHYGVAINRYKSGLKARESLLQLDIDNLNVMRDISISHEKIGDVYLAKIKPIKLNAKKMKRRAYPFFRESYKIRLRILQLSSSPRSYRDVWLSMQRLVDDKKSDVSWRSIQEMTRKLDGMGMISLSDATYVEFVRNKVARK